jgi:Kip1 ubiquitination-promoting complex protein 1
MRALEMIITIAPMVFKDSLRANSDNLLGRICQLVIQVLSRVTVPPSCFQFVVDLCLPDLTNVTHFAILTASIGILLALMEDEMDQELDLMQLPKVSRLILTDTSFQIANLEFILGDIKSKIHFPLEQPRGNFDPQTRSNIDPLTNEIKRQASHRMLHDQAFKPDPPILKFKLSDFMTHVNQEEILKVERLIDTLQKRQSLLSETTLISDDALCPICYAKQNSAVFEPCKHQSCE